MQLLIGGKWVDAQSGKTFPNLDPRTGGCCSLRLGGLWLVAKRPSWSLERQLHANLWRASVPPALAVVLFWVPLENNTSPPSPVWLAGEKLCDCAEAMAEDVDAAVRAAKDGEGSCSVMHRRLRLEGCWWLGSEHAFPRQADEQCACLPNTPLVASPPTCAAYDNGPWPRMTGYQRGRILERFANLVEVGGLKVASSSFKLPALQPTCQEWHAARPLLSGVIIMMAASPAVQCHLCSLHHLPSACSFVKQAAMHAVHAVCTVHQPVNQLLPYPALYPGRSILKSWLCWRRSTMARRTHRCFAGCLVVVELTVLLEPECSGAVQPCIDGSLPAFLRCCN